MAGIFDSSIFDSDIFETVTGAPPQPAIPLTLRVRILTLLLPKRIISFSLKRGK